jgi:hypothetical protein
MEEQGRGRTCIGKAGQDFLPLMSPKAIRYDDGKNQLELIPAEWIWALGSVLTYGAKKYAVRNWEKGMKWSRVIGSLLRHVTRFMIGERYDQESGHHHLAHAAWNCLALMSYDLRKIGEDDRGDGAPGWLDEVKACPEQSTK